MDRTIAKVLSNCSSLHPSHFTQVHISNLLGANKQDSRTIGAISDITDFLLYLYRSVNEVPFPILQDHVIDLLNKLLGFDLAIWGIGKLDNDKPCFFGREWSESPRKFDTWDSIVTAHPYVLQVKQHVGNTFLANTCSQELDKNISISQVLCTSFTHSYSELTFVLILRRKNHFYTEQDRLALSRISPHLAEAHNSGLVHQLLHNKRAPNENLWSNCIAYSNGLIYHSENDFRAKLEVEFGTLRNFYMLPLRVLQTHANKDSIYCGKNITFIVKQIGDLLLIKVKRITPIDSLSKRESEIAKLFVSGLTYKEIARKLTISPATVRTHIYAAYSKVGVSNKIGLANLFWPISQSENE